MNLTPTDFTAAASGLSAIKTGFDLAKNLVEMVKRPEVDRTEIQSALLQLQEKILDAQRSLGDLQEQNRQLVHALAQREHQQAVLDDMEIVVHGNFYIRRSERDKGTVVRYCPVCRGHDEKAVPLVQCAEGLFECAIDKARFWTKAYKERQARAYQTYSVMR